MKRLFHRSKWGIFKRTHWNLNSIIWHGFLEVQGNCNSRQMSLGCNQLHGETCFGAEETASGKRKKWFDICHLNFEQQKKIRTIFQVKTTWPKVIHWSSQPAFIGRPYFNLGRHKGQANCWNRSELILLFKYRSHMVMYVTN